MTTDEEKLIASHQLRSNMQILDNTKLSPEQKNQALENLFDGYLMYQQNSSSPDLSFTNELKKELSDSVAFTLDLQDLTQSIDKLKHLSKLFEHLQKHNLLNHAEFSKNISELTQQLSTLQKNSQKLTLAEAQKQKTNQNEIKKLLTKASDLTSNEKEQAQNKKKSDKKTEAVKAFLETIYAEKQRGKTASVTKVELQEVNGKTSILVTDTQNQTQSFKLGATPIKQKNVFGGYTDSQNHILSKSDLNNRIKLSADLLDLLKENNALNFGEQTIAPTKKKSKGYTPQDFCKDLKIKLTKSQAPDLPQELTAYNTLLLQDKKAATDLMQKLKDKYSYQTCLAEKVQTEQQIAETVKQTNFVLTQIMSQADDNCLLTLSAPTSGQNKDMLQHRQQFAEFINLTCRPNTLSTARQKALIAFRQEENFWKNNNEEYYNLIKKCAEDPFYQTRAQQMFSGKKKPQDILKEQTDDLFSSDLAKKVLARAVIVYGMGNALRKPDPKKTNEILKTFGFQINLTPIKVEAARKTTSKEITAIMRCLADGHSFEPEKQPIVATRLKIKEHQEELQQIFGKDKNYTLLVENPLNNKTSQEKPERTPYQTHNMKIGLLAALSPEISENIDFSEKIKRSLPKQDQTQWNLDDYLFTRYMNLYFKQQISPSNKDLIKKLKICYDWNGFKAKHISDGKQIYADFSNIDKKNETLIFNALTEGTLNECTQHHYNPLKFAVVSAKPLEYNDKIITSLQTKPWQENWHDFHHLSTIEGTDMVPAYCLKTDKGYERKDQIQLNNLFQSENKSISVYSESLQIPDKNGQYHDIMSQDAFFICSDGHAVSEPQPTSNALDFARQNQQFEIVRTSCLEREQNLVIAVATKNGADQP